MADTYDPPRIESVVVIDAPLVGVSSGNVDVPESAVFR
jgi:hypothetical protein